MKRTFGTIAAAALVAAALAACGGASPIAQSTPVRSGYYNMATLDNEIQQVAGQRLTAMGSTVTVTSVACFMDGSQTASCGVSASDGAVTQVEATISADGAHFTTPGTYVPPGG